MRLGQALALVWIALGLSFYFGVKVSDELLAFLLCLVMAQLVVRYR